MRRWCSSLQVKIWNIPPTVIGLRGCVKWWRAGSFMACASRMGIMREPGTAVDLFSVSVPDGPMSQDQTSRLREFAHQHIGKPYDYLSVARFISRRSESIHSKEKWFCSEFVFAAFQAAGLNLLRDTEAWEVSPGLLSKSPLLHPEGSLQTATARLKAQEESAYAGPCRTGQGSVTLHPTL
jgi:hypothetical protein